MRTEKLKTEQRQEQLTAAVLEIIALHGLKKLSVARVSRRVGLVPSAIYRHFKSKDEMIDAALAFIGNRLLQNVHEVRAETNDGPERLRRLLMRHALLIRENQAIPKMIFSEEIYSGHPDRKLKLRRIVQGYLNQIVKIVEEGQQKGQILSSIEPSTVSVMLLGLFQPAAILWYLTDGDFDITKHAAKAWVLFSQTIRPDPEKRSAHRIRKIKR